MDIFIYLLIIIIFTGSIIWVIYIRDTKIYFEEITYTDVTYESPAKISGNQQKIPYTIVQTNKNNQVSIYMKNEMQNIINLNPEYNYKYFDDNMCREYISVNYGSEYTTLFDSLIPGAYKADLFRACYLYKDGGVYLDSSFKMLLPLNKLIEEDDEIILPIDGKYSPSMIYNACMMSVPNHQIFKEYLAALRHTIKNKIYGKCPLHFTGPGCLGKVYNKMHGPVKIGKRNDGIKIVEHKTGEHPGDTIMYNNQVFIHTRYSNYNNEPRSTSYYAVLWHQKKVFK